MANENKESENVSKTLLGANDKGRVTYNVNGEEVNLSFNIVRLYLTRGQGKVTDSELIMFITLCKSNGLNPFNGDCYLIKYDDRTPASMVTARDAFMRRAEGAPVYDGFQSGVIIIRNNQVVENEGSFFLPNDQLVGGWAKVFRADRKFPTVQKVRLSEYNTGKSNWASKPGTMIQKVAEAQAFRRAFPMNLNGMYIAEEMPDEQSGEAPTQELENAQQPKFIDAPAPEETKDQEAQEFTPDPEPAEQEAGPDPALVKAGLIDPDPEEQPRKDLFTL